MKAKFKEFDKQGSGLVKKETVAEVVFHIVQILGIPPPETSQGTRTLYTDIADQLEPEAGRLLTVEEFCTTCVGAFNSIADSLAKNPLTISQVFSCNPPMALNGTHPTRFSLRVPFSIAHLLLPLPLLMPLHPSPVPSISPTPIPSPSPSISRSPSPSGHMEGLQALARQMERCRSWQNQNN